MSKKGKGNRRKWTDREDHIIRAVVLSCEKMPHYYEACEFLCEVLDRRSEIDIEKPTKEQWRYATENIIRRRLWAMFTRYRGRKPDALDETYYRDKLPLSYVEKVYVLRKYHNSKIKGKVTLEELAMLLGRKSTAPIEAYLKKLNGPNFTDMEVPQAKSMLRANRKKVAKHVEELLHLVGPDLKSSEFRSVWQNLNQYLIQEPN